MFVHSNSCGSAGTVPRSGRIAGGEAAGANAIHGTLIDAACRSRGYDHVIAAGPQVTSAVRARRADQRGDHVAVFFEGTTCWHRRPGEWSIRCVRNLTTVTLVSMVLRIAQRTELRR